MEIEVVEFWNVEEKKNEIQEYVFCVFASANT